MRNSFVLGAGNTYAVGATGGSTDAIVVSHTHAATSVVSDPSHSHGISVNNSSTSYGGGPSIFGSGSTLNTNAATTGITVATTNATAGVSGSGANMPPYYALAYIMKS